MCRPDNVVLHCGMGGGSSKVNGEYIATTEKILALILAPFSLVAPIS